MSETPHQRGDTRTEHRGTLMSDAVASTAAVAGHPIHPMLIPFPIAFLVGTLAADLGWLATGDEFWSRGAFALLIAGLVSGALAGVFGAVDFFTIERARRSRAGLWHAVGNVIVLALAVVNLFLRMEDPAEGIVPGGLALSAVIAALLAITSWFGGELSYRELVGVKPKEPATSEARYE